MCFSVTPENDECTEVHLGVTRGLNLVDRDVFHIDLNDDDIK